MDRRAVSMLRDLAREGGSTVIVRGRCMEPLLPDGTAVHLRARRAWIPGDVIVFRTRTGELAAHRVLGWRPAGVITKGDHCDVHDAPVASADIVGVVDVHVSMRERLRAVAELLAIAIRRLRR